MVRRRGLLLCVLSACGGSYYGTVPVGWRGSIPTCEQAEVTGGDVVRREDSGSLSAVREGRATLRCKDGSKTDVGVKQVARLAIDGSRALSPGWSSGYRLHAYDARGAELSFGDPMLEVIDWSTSSTDASIRAAYCHEPVFGCPNSSYAQLTVPKSGIITVRAQFAGQTALLDVTVR